jgi:hypothetical protein
VLDPPLGNSTIQAKSGWLKWASTMFMTCQRVKINAVVELSGSCSFGPERSEWKWGNFTKIHAYKKSKCSTSDLIPTVITGLIIQEQLKSTLTVVENTFGHFKY